MNPIPPGTKDAMDRAYINSLKPKEKKMDQKLEKVFRGCFAICLLLLLTGMCLGLTGVWVDGFSDSELSSKLHQTNWILFTSSCAAAIVSGIGSKMLEQK